MALMKKRKILLIVFKGIGDVILTTPFIEALKKANPDNKIYFLTKKFAAPVIENNPNLNGIFIREDKPLLKILSMKFDCCFDFMLSSSSGAYCLFSGASERVAFYRPWNSILYNKRVQSDFQGYNAIKRLQLLKALGLNPAAYYDLKPKIFLTHSQVKYAQDFLQNLNLGGSKIATFDITSPRIYRQPRPSLFVAIANRLEKQGYFPIFSAGPGEEDYVKKALVGAKFSHYIAENLTLSQLCAIISMSHIHIGTSSAPMHIAVSFNKPTFTIYSPYTCPAAWEPKDKNHGFFQKDLCAITENELIDAFEFFFTGIRNGS